MKKEVDEESKLYGKQIFKIRTEQKISRKYVASFLGVSGQQLFKYEKGKNTLKGCMIAKIAKVLNVSINDIMESNL